jgi:hypothetical protein
MNTFFSDINQTGYLGDMTQYYCHCTATLSKANIANLSTLAGSWQDTQAYPHNPLTETDIQNEVDHAIQTNGWSADSDSQVNIVLGSGSGWGNCGEHNYFFDSRLGFDVFYTVIPWNKTGCAISTCPNRCDVDTAMNALSHETFEETTDPLIDAWRDDTTSHAEIGDKCAYLWGNLAYQNGSANHRWGPSTSYRYYSLQMEWDDAYTAVSSNGWCTNYGPTYTGALYTS